MLAATDTRPPESGAAKAPGAPLASRAHLPALDGVRGWAILLVMIHHMAVFIPTTPAQQTALGVLQIGWVGVDLFFVLSGFLITGILLDSRGGPGYFRSFYARRVLRIFPLYYLICAFSFIVLPHLPLPSIKAQRFATVGGDQWMYWTFLSNIALAKFGGPRHGIMDVTWSLAIEEQFYIVWPALVLMLRPRTLGQLCILIILASPLLRLTGMLLNLPVMSVYAFTLCRLDGLCAGALIALIARGHFQIRPTPRLGAVLIGCGAALFAASAVAARGINYWDAGAPLISFGFTGIVSTFAGILVLALTIPNAPILRMINNAPMRTLGKYSYAIYLFHLPLRAFIRDRVMHPERFPAYPGGVFTAQFLFYVVSIAAVFAAAWISFRVYERPFLRLKRFVPEPVTEPVSAFGSAPAVAHRSMS